MKPLMIVVSMFFGGFSFLLPVVSMAADLVRPVDSDSIVNFAKKMDEEFSYRTGVDAEANKWASELMFMYKWPLLYPKGLDPRKNSPTNNAAIKQRLRSEYAWLTVTGQGALATFDFTHAEQSILGSTSRFAIALTRSPSFWTEVRKQCIEIDDLKRKASSSPGREINIDGCAKRFQRDIEISQMIGSNVSLFISGGFALALGKKLFVRYASQWVTARVVPIIPAFVKTKWALAGLTVAVIVVPAGFILASSREEQEHSRAFVEGLQARLDENQTALDQASVLRFEAMQLEGAVLQLAIWAHPRIPKTNDETENRRFLEDMNLFGPGVDELQTKRADLEKTRDRIEQELSSIPEISAQLARLVELRKNGTSKLSETDLALFRKAQYLASLRLVTKLLDARQASVTVSSGRQP